MILTSTVLLLSKLCKKLKKLAFTLINRLAHLVCDHRKFEKKEYGTDCGLAGGKRLYL